MKCIWHILLVFLLCNLQLSAQSIDVESVLEDIYNQLSEEGDVLLEDIRI